MPSGPRVVITDFERPDFEIEQAVLAAIDARVVRENVRTEDEVIARCRAKRLPVCSGVAFPPEVMAGWVAAVGSATASMRSRRLMARRLRGNRRGNARRAVTNLLLRVAQHGHQLLVAAVVRPAGVLGRPRRVENFPAVNFRREMPVGYAPDLVDQLALEAAVNKLLPRMVDDLPRLIDNEDVSALAKLNVAAQPLDHAVVEVHQERSPVRVGSRVTHVTA